MKLTNVILLPSGSHDRVDITVTNGFIESIEPTETGITEPPGLLLPSLCHPHIHLDKPYILTCNHNGSAQFCPDSASSEGGSYPDYSDLNPQSGDFQEALTNTSLAKARYTPEDLYLRGAQLLAASYKQGVTHVRAFVEVDHAVGFKTLEAGIKLKRDFAHLIEVQLCVFAQDPIESGPHGEENKRLVLQALEVYASSIDVLGTTPYVEASRDAAVANIRWAVETALKLELHLDFHIDYDLDKDKQGDQSLAHAVISELGQKKWTEKAQASKTVVLGHATRLTVFDKAALVVMVELIKSQELPIHWVGLPTSDLFMMGRQPVLSRSERPPYLERPRGTLPAPGLIREGLNACLGVNNVGNAFTPYGTGDPLAMTSWGVGLYHAGTVEDAQLLYACVSWRARRAIGLEDADESTDLQQGSKWRPMLLVQNQATIDLPGTGDYSNEDSAAACTLKIPARQRLSIKDVVWDTPDVEFRTVVRWRREGTKV